MTPEFIKDLRRKVGKERLWISGVEAFVENEKGEVLLAKRKDDGLWCVVAGIIEPGEQPADAAAREVEEETGVKCIPEKVARVESMTEPRIYPNGDEVLALNILFCCHAGGHQIPACPDGENEDSGWFPPSRLPSPISQRTLSLLSFVKARRGPEAAFLFEGRPRPGGGEAPKKGALAARRVSTDGSALSNPEGAMGWAWVDQESGERECGGCRKGTNQVGELTAVLMALRRFREGDLLIETDSRYAIGCSRDWVKAWKKRGWKKADGSPVKNLPLIRAIDEEISKRGGSVEFAWVKGHAGNPFNEAADSLASGCARGVAGGEEGEKLPPEARESLRGM
ncbi:MAG: NUDIX domain-containing protein [Aeriscardovia sp.]|nr:NUDIX domain-containing protein [Aeriscardovia sp.]